MSRFNSTTPPGRAEPPAGSIVLGTRTFEIQAVCPSAENIANRGLPVDTFRSTLPVIGVENQNDAIDNRGRENKASVGRSLRIEGLVHAKVSHALSQLQIRGIQKRQFSLAGDDQTRLISRPGKPRGETESVFASTRPSSELRRKT